MSTQPITRARRERRVPVFNPSHLAADVMAFGDFYHFDPMSIGTCGCVQHNVPDLNGRRDNIGCHNKYEHARNEKQHLLLEAPMSVAGEGRCTADAVAEFIVSAESMGAKGFVILEGNAQDQEHQKRAAIEKYVAFHMTIVEETISSWEAQVASFRLARPGAAVPRQPRHVTEAYAFREKHMSAVEDADRGLLICSLCGSRQPDQAKLDGHVERSHPAAFIPSAAPSNVTHMPAPRPALQAVPPPEEEPDPSEEEFSDGVGSVSAGPLEDNVPNDLGDQARSTPQREETGVTTPAAMNKREQVAYVRRISADAKAIGVELSVADEAGLEAKNPEVMRDILARIKAKREGK